MNLEEDQQIIAKRESNHLIWNAAMESLHASTPSYLIPKVNFMFDNNVKIQSFSNLEVK
jgi:hypothetical protein